MANEVKGRWLSDITPLKKGEKRSQFGNDTVDIQFTHALVRDMENLMCIDTTRIYAVGLGVGGGMMHILACDPTLSASFAAFAAVGGVFGKGKEGKRPWGVCKPARRVPIMEIHGLDDQIAGYILRENENGKKRMIPKHWVEEWADRNGCGVEEGEAKQSEEEPATFVTKLTNGVLTESIQYGGSVRRIARNCFPKAKVEEAKEPEPEDEEDLTVASEDEKSPLLESDLNLPTTALPDANSTVLHYTVAGYSHGWPRQHLKRQQYVQYKDQHFALADESDTFFDTTKIIFQYFAAHVLEDRWANRTLVPQGEQEGGPTPMSEEEMAKKMKEQYGFEHADLGKDKLSEAESEMEKKMKQFKEAQEKIQKGTGEEKDEL
jgi:poly(3-hydroxybutyrate) depolymerase